jgi:septal ring factor EnvC (AmiA/AmiB activator)
MRGLSTMGYKFSENSALERIAKDKAYLERQREDMKKEISDKIEAARNSKRHLRHTEYLISDYEETLKKLQG